MKDGAMDDWLNVRYGFDSDDERERRAPTELSTSPLFMTAVLVSATLFLFSPVLVSFGAVTAALVDGADYLIAAPRWTTIELLSYALRFGFAAVVITVAVQMGVPHIHWINEDPGLPRVWWISGAREDGDLFTFYWRRRLCAIPMEYVARRLNRFVFKGSWKVMRYPGAEFDLVFVPAQRAKSDGEARAELRDAGVRRQRQQTREAAYGAGGELSEGR